MLQLDEPQWLVVRLDVLAFLGISMLIGKILPRLEQVQASEGRRNLDLVSIPVTLPDLQKVGASVTVEVCVVLGNFDTLDNAVPEADLVAELCSCTGTWHTFHKGNQH